MQSTMMKGHGQVYRQNPIFLLTPEDSPVCSLNGVDPDTVSIRRESNQFKTLSFTVRKDSLYRKSKNVGKITETYLNTSAGYNLLKRFMRLYINGHGRFIIESVSTVRQVDEEYKQITAYSEEHMFMNHDVKDLKINKGTHDSYEYLIPGNVDKFGKAIENIKLIDLRNNNLSLLHILFKEAGIRGWSLGYIDPGVRKTKVYDGATITEKEVSIYDMVGDFDIESQDLYSLLTQDVAKYFQCVFDFDTTRRKVNIYMVENYGKLCDFKIGYRNIQEELSITNLPNDFFSQYSVSGGGGLSISYVNYGSNVIEWLSDSFLNSGYFNSTLVKHYQEWRDWRDNNRDAYMRLVGNNNQAIKDLTALETRVPIEQVRTDWDAMSEDALLGKMEDFNAQVTGIEDLYTDEHGTLDVDALNKSPDGPVYWQLKDKVIPDIQAAIDRKQGIDTPDAPTMWEYYGLHELEAEAKVRQNQIDLAVERGCDVPWTPSSSHSQEYHTKLYNIYLEATNDLDESVEGTLGYALKQVRAECGQLQAQIDTYTEQIASYNSLAEKENWMSSTEIQALSNVAVMGDYYNDNIFRGDTESIVDQVNTEYQLFSEALRELKENSEEHYSYNGRIDNFFILPEYIHKVESLEIGDFITAEQDLDKNLHLRVISIEYNPYAITENVSVGFADRINANSLRSDFTRLLGVATLGR